MKPFALGLSKGFSIKMVVRQAHHERQCFTLIWKANGQGTLATPGQPWHFLLKLPFNRDLFSAACLTFRSSPNVQGWTQGFLRQRQ